MNQDNERHNEISEAYFRGVGDARGEYRTEIEAAYDRGKRDARAEYRAEIEAVMEQAKKDANAQILAEHYENGKSAGRKEGYSAGMEQAKDLLDSIASFTRSLRA